jgi:3'-5' exoribonuclease
LTRYRQTATIKCEAAEKRALTDSGALFFVAGDLETEMVDNMKLAELRVGNKIDHQEVILWVQKSSQSANGSWFVRGSVEDASGSLGFICFNSESVSRVKELTAAVPAMVSGQIQADRYGGEGKLQLLAEVIEMIPAGRDVSHLLPATSKDLELYKKKFAALVTQVKKPPLRELLHEIFSGARWEQFVRNPAAKRFHHAYIGGLLEHSVDVAETALAVAAIVPGVDRDLVIAGALLHDIGKTEEISSDIGFAYTETGHLLGHITAGALIVEKTAGLVQFLSEADRKSLLHIVLAHHGSAEHGSPVSCATQEAVIVHYADEMNAVLQQFAAAGGKDGPGWSYNKMLGHMIRANETSV